jgi:hypothetical protein
MWQRILAHDNGRVGLMRYVRATFAWFCLGGFVATSAAATPMPSSYCVKPVKIEKRQVFGLANTSKAPTKFLLAGEADTPLAIDEVRRPTDNCRYKDCYTVERVYWKFTPRYTFSGPYISEYSLSGETTDGATIYLKGGRYRTDTEAAKQSHDGKQWETRFYTATQGGVPEKLGYPLDDESWNYHSGEFLPERGYAVSASSNSADGKQQWRYFVIRGLKVTELGADIKIPDAVFPKWNIEVSAGEQDVEIHDRKTGSTLSLSLPPTDDFGGFESLNIDRYGWLFLENYGNDYAVKWERRDNQLKLARLVKFTGSGWMGRLVRWLLPGSLSTRVDETHYSPQCVSFSPVLQLTLFCKPAKVLHNGQLEDIGGADVSDAGYLADATGKGVALLKKRDGSLFAYDGKQVQKVGSTNSWSGGEVFDFKTLGRTFVVTSTGTAELVGRFPKLSLENIPLDASQMKWMKDGATYGINSADLQIIPGSSDIAIFSPAGIRVWEQNEWRWAWREELNPIDSSQRVVPVGVWKGVLFVTNNSDYKLLTRCGVEW